jgi:hypothetical protein
MNREANAASDRRSHCINQTTSSVVDPLKNLNANIDIDFVTCTVTTTALKNIQNLIC